MWAVELLREGAIRLPAGLGQTLTIAATLIMGQAILQAQVVSPMLLVTAGFTTVASFAIPDYSAFIGLRLIRFPLMLAAGFL
ncbi:MAG: spore germination protein [Bacillota bacterium]|nr:spore germination protein [Bacillota bacterium]